MITLPVYNCEGREIESIKLDEKIFSDKINISAVYQAICQFRAGQRSGTASVKTRGEVAGGGKKPWKQKGTGRARVGSIRSPLWRHGGVIFGPHPRDFSYSIPRKIKVAALRSALSAKAMGADIIAVDTFGPQEPKTKSVIKILRNLPAYAPGKSLLIIASPIDDKLRRACANIKCVKIVLPASVNAYDVLAAHKIITTVDALKELTRRLG